MISLFPHTQCVSSFHDQVPVLTLTISNNSAHFSFNLYGAFLPQFHLKLIENILAQLPVGKNLKMVT